MAVYNPERLVVDELEYGVQVDGKIRERMRARKNASDEELGKAALSGPKVKEAVEGKTVSKVIIVRGKLVNIVLRK